MFYRIYNLVSIYSWLEKVVWTIENVQGVSYNYLEKGIKYIHSYGFEIRVKFFPLVASIHLKIISCLNFHWKNCVPDFEVLNGLCIPLLFINFLFSDPKNFMWVKAFYF